MVKLQNFLNAPRMLQF